MGHISLEEEDSRSMGPMLTRNNQKKYVGVQSWKAMHLPTLDIQVEQNLPLRFDQSFFLAVLILIYVADADFKDFPRSIKH